ncbi:hypothetical protein BYT27DRAFT_7208111 [Phlegmacium glaucopus]|nr:hypothetical protein BYT27DRAFT_7208111 [Phlegmacium glaucopus]
MSSTCTSMTSLATPPPTISLLENIDHPSIKRHPQDAGNVRICIKPSSLIKCAVIKRAKMFHSRIKQDHTMRLAAEEFCTQRLRMLHQTSRSRAAAEENQCREQEKELQVLVLAAQKGLNWTSLEPQLALALARAARDTLMAEEKTAKLRVEECKGLLATLQDSMDDAHARAEDAHHQIASIMTLFDQEVSKCSNSTVTQMSENSPHEAHYPPLVRPGVFVIPANPSSSSHNLQPQPAPAALSLAAFSNYQGPPEFQEDIYGPVAPSLAAFSNYDRPPEFHKVNASQSSLLFPNQVIPRYEFPHQLLGMGTQPLNATRSTQPLPSFHPIQRMNSMNSMTSISDGTSDAHTHQSGSISQHSVISSTMNPRHRRPNNPTQTRPALRDYQGTKTYDILVIAKETFTATAFSAGLFFYYKCSPHIQIFRTMSLDIFTHTAQKRDCSDIRVDNNHVTILLSTLGAIRGAVKKEARFIVEKQYHLLEINNEEGAYEIQELSPAEGIALRVKELLDNSGPSNMAFTDGQADKHAIVGKSWKAYLCLEEWATGTQVNRNLEAISDERKYNNILSGITAAENDPYAGPILTAMYHDWWDYALQTNGLEAWAKQTPFRKTYGPQSTETGQSGSTLQTSVLSWDVAPLPSAPQEGSFSDISFYDICNPSALLSEAASSSWLNDEIYRLSAD